MGVCLTLRRFSHSAQKFGNGAKLPEDYQQEVSLFRGKKFLAVGAGICGLYPPQTAWAQADQSTASEEFYDSGIVHYEAGRYEEAIADFDEALLLDSGFVNALYLRGWSKWQLGKNAEAIEDFNKTIELRPFDPQPYFLRGYAKVSLALYEDAIANYDESLRLNPNRPNVFHRRGVALAAAV